MKINVRLSDPLDSEWDCLLDADSGSRYVYADNGSVVAKFETEVADSQSLKNQNDSVARHIVYLHNLWLEEAKKRK